jgi:hypothetical protein
MCIIMAATAAYAQQATSFLGIPGLFIRVIERTNAWLQNYRRVLVRFGRLLPGRASA